MLVLAEVFLHRRTNLGVRGDVQAHLVRVYERSAPSMLCHGLRHALSLRTKSAPVRHRNRRGRTGCYYYDQHETRGETSAGAPGGPGLVRDDLYVTDTHPQPFQFAPSVLKDHFVS